MTSDPWYQGTPEIRCEIECGNESHTVVWNNGGLTLENHDLDAEKALAALGSEIPPCIEVQEAWSQRHEMSELLRAPDPIGIATLAESNISNLATLLGHIVSAGHSTGQVGPAKSRLQRDMERNRAIKTLMLLDPRVVRLAIGDFIAEKMRIQRDNNPSDSDMMMMQEYLTSRVQPLLADSMRSWRRLDPGTLLTTECWLGRPDSEPAIFGWMSHHGGFAGVTTGLGWLLDVAMREIALVDGCFILKRTRSGADLDWHDVIAIRWEPQWDASSVASISGVPAEKVDRYFADRWTPKPAPAMVFRSGDGWHLSWT